MSYVIVCLAAGFASLLTLYSGFGLGTLLLPVFVLFFPVEAAVAATAVVHLANNLLKLGLLGPYADRRVVLRFGVAAVLAAFAGAYVLTYTTSLPTLAAYSLGSRRFEITAAKLMIALLMGGFALLEALPRLAELTVPPRYLVLGGALSGFFGGVSGHQGALRAAFLVRSGLSTQAFLGTTAVCAVLVDVARLTVYGQAFSAGAFRLLGGSGGLGLILAGMAAALCGTIIGTRLLHKVTFRQVRLLVTTLLLLLAVALGIGVV